MPIFKWQQQKHDIFGKTLIPVAKVCLGGSTLSTQEIELPINSAAAMTLLPNSTGEALGLNITSGRKITVDVAGTTSIQAFLHELELRFEGQPAFNAPVAISADDKASGFLGRVGIFDQFQFDFDSTLSETRVFPVWLSHEQAHIWKGLSEISQYIALKSGENPLPSPANDVANRFINMGGQVVAGAAGLIKLHRAHECPLLIRRIFELSAQFNFIMDDPTTRSDQYLEFEHICRWRLIKSNLDYPDGEVGTSLTHSKLRAKGEVDAKREFDRVFPRYKRRNSNKTWDSWYCMTFRDLCKDIGWETEYVRWYARFSGWAHGDAFATQHPHIYNPNWYLLFCYVYYGRILKSRADEGKIILTADHHSVLERLSEPFS